MKINMKHLVTATFLVAAIGGVVPRGEATQSESAAVIIEWNQLAQLRIGGPPFSQLRQYAMLHVAMADAVVAIEGRYEPFEVSVRAPHGASARAAAAQAGHDVLVALFLPILSTPPTTDDAAAAAAIAAFDAKLAADLAGIPPGLRWNGVQVGKKVAAEVIRWRQGDGFANADPVDPPLPWPPDYVPVFEASTLPGIWRQTASGRPSFAKLGDVEPFGVLSPSQFLPDAMPQLESAEYATDFDEVKSEGERPNPFPTTKAGFTAKHRTALLWAGGAGTPFANVTNAFRVWFNVARDVGPSLSLVQTARLFALLSTSMFDGVQTSQASKFVYRLWRPETAIANAGPVGGDPDYDDNPDTDGQPGWIPLLATPPYPSHSSNMQCIGASAARTLRNVFRSDDKAFTVKWFASNGDLVHESAYTTFSSLSVEEGNSRVWGGIHFRFELTDSIESCSNVADYIFYNKMQQSGYRYH